MPKNNTNDPGLKYLRELIKRYPQIKDPKEFARLLNLWKTHGNQEIYNRLLYGNTGLVISIAKKYTNRGVDFLDLIQEGLMGMARALETYDPEQSRISTYATCWIKHFVRKAVSGKSRTIPIPSYMQDKMTCVNREITSFLAETGHLPTNQEIYDRIRALDGTKKETAVSKKMKLRDVVRCRTLLYSGTSSLDTPTRSPDGEKASTLLGDTIADTTVNIEAEVELNQLQKTVLEGIKRRLQKEKSPQRMLTILRLRFELGQTLQQVGNHLGFTRERIRQVEKDILAKLARDLKMTRAGLVAILSEMGLGAEEEKLASAHNTLPKMIVVPVPELFIVLCQHVILTPAGLRIVKEPVGTLKTREGLSSEDAVLALEGMKKEGLIEGKAPWKVITIIPEVDIPEYKSYK